MLADSELGDKAVARPMFRGARSDSMVRNQVCRGRPERRCQSLGKRGHAGPKGTAVVHGSISASNVAKELQTSGMNDLCEWWRGS